MKLHIHHQTTHTYASPVSFGIHHCFLIPHEAQGRRVTSFDLTASPKAIGRWVNDAEGNVSRAFTFGIEPSMQLQFDLEMLVEIDEQNPFDFLLDIDATGYPFSLSDSDRRVLQPMLEIGEPTGAKNWFQDQGVAPETHDDIVQFLADLNTTVHDKISYVRRDEEGIQPPEETISKASGSCRDMAVLMMHGVRELGLAARFVSGYLYDPPEGDAHLFNRAVGSMHAWVEVYLPGAGWKGFDPTNGILANEFFIPTAVSVEPERIDPIQGTYFADTSVSSTLTVDLTLEECSDDPA